MNALSSGFNSRATYSDGSCPPVVPGCTDSAASNYRPAANSDDGSECRYVGCLVSSASNFDSRAIIPGECIMPVFGCTDSAAINYYFDATVEDGTCFFAGCTDSRLSNYDVSANVDDGSCGPAFFGCTEVGALNYNAVYNANNGLCSFGGCTISSDENFDPTATFYDGTCNEAGRRKLRSRRTLADVGCMDPSSTTYVSIATTNNQSLCSYPILGCTDSRARNYLVSAKSDRIPSECTYDVGGCTIPAYTLNYDSSATVLSECTFERPGCTISTAANYLPSANVPYDESCLQPFVLGCADPTALDYSSTATISTACTYNIVGCTDSSSSTYTSDATESNPDLCVAFVLGCMLPQAVNYVPTATRDDGSCTLFSPPSPAVSQWPSPPSTPSLPPPPSPLPPLHQVPPMPPDPVSEQSGDNLSSQDAGVQIWIIIIIVVVVITVIIAIVVFYMRHKQAQGGSSEKWFGSRARSAMTYVGANTSLPSEAKLEPPTTPFESVIHSFAASNSTEYSTDVDVIETVKPSQVQMELNYETRPASSAGSRAVGVALPAVGVALPGATDAVASWRVEEETAMAEEETEQVIPDSGPPPPYHQSDSAKRFPSPPSLSQTSPTLLDNVASGTSSVAQRSLPGSRSPGISALDADSDSNSEYGDATALPEP